MIDREELKRQIMNITTSASRILFYQPSNATLGDVAECEKVAEGYGLALCVLPPDLVDSKVFNKFNRDLIGTYDKKKRIKLTAKFLTALGIKFAKHNNNFHFIIDCDNARMNYYPSTFRWELVVGGRLSYRGEGVWSMLNALYVYDGSVFSKNTSEEYNPVINLEDFIGKEVKLRNGTKARVIYQLPERYSNKHSFIGYCDKYDGGDVALNMCWDVNGKSWAYYGDELRSAFDIVGLWEERPSVSVNFPAPIKNLPTEGSVVYVVKQTGRVEEKVWENTPYFISRLESGFIFATKESAEKFLEALSEARR